MVRAKTTKASNETAAKTAATYSELRAQLDGIMEKLQDPDCDVDDAVELYAQALQCLNLLEQHLRMAENKVKRVQADLQACPVR